MADKSLLLVCRHSPYRSGRARAGLDTALAVAAFDQSVQLLFLGDGVLQLLPDQNGRELGKRDIGKLLASFNLYDIDQVYLEAESASRYGITPETLGLNAVSLDADQVRVMLSAADHVLGF